MKNRDLAVIIVLILLILFTMAWTLYSISIGELDFFVLAGTLTTFEIIFFIDRIKPHL